MGKIWLAAWAAVLLLTGCATWQKVEAPHKDVTLANEHLTVVFPRENLFLPNSAKAADGRELLAGGKCFRTILTWKDAQDQPWWDDEDNASRPSHRIVRVEYPTKGLEEEPSFRVVMQTDHFDVTRTCRLLRHAPVLRFSYEFRCRENVTLHAIDGLYLPHVHLAPAFTHGAFVKGGQVIRAELAPKGAAMALMLPEPYPVFTADATGEAACALLPVSAQPNGLFAPFGPNRIQKGQSFAFTFDFAYVTGASDAALATIEKPYAKAATAFAKSMALARQSYIAHRSGPAGSLVFSQEALRLDPSSGYAANAVAYSYQQLRDRPNTAKYWELAFELEPSMTPYAEWAATSIRTAVARGELPKSRLTDALELGEASVAGAPNSPFHHKSLAETYLALGRKQEALAHYRKALHLFKTRTRIEAYRKREIPQAEAQIRKLDKELAERP